LDFLGFFRFFTTPFDSPGCCPGSATDYREARHSCGEVVQLPRPGDTTHPTSADAGFDADVGVQSDPVKDRLLQRSVSRHSGRDTSIQRVQNNAARIVLQAPRRFDAKPLLRRLHWLAAGRTENHLQEVENWYADVQGPKHRNTSLPQPPHTDAGLCVESSIVERSIAGTTFHENRLRNARLPLLGTCCLELTS